MSSRKMKVVMAGVGGYGAHRRELMRKTGLFKLVAAYDFNNEALSSCEKEDGAKPFGSYDELLDVKDAEAVIISTGASSHAEMAIKAMQKGLHVFVEKPLCATMEDLKSMLEIQKNTGCVVAVGHINHIYDSFSSTLKKMIEDGELGKVSTFEKTTCHNGGLFLKTGDWREDPANNPGGMLFQCGVHGFHELMFLFGPIERVSCMMRYDVHTSRTADVAQCILEFESGIIGTLGAYHVSPYRHTFNIFGTKRNIYSNSRYFDEGKQIYMQETRLDHKKEPMLPIEFSEKSDVSGNLKSFYKSVREGGEPYPSIKDGARAVAVVFAAEESARTGRSVKVEKF